MPEDRTTPWPEDLFEFAYVPDMPDNLRRLAEQAEQEDWNYHNTPSDKPYPILYNYFRYT